ncbi:bactofilin family protein [Rhodovulum euryhalinum]|uniref:Cytoskeletal protein CcmA (Bactofilin family) n=1 Tax=Rhodovulum euryhalinum TaxID=35805 RepID=A0A4R2KTX1_9RHOB|nr:polymer-forming cytoskeletal protein [Rhodovulum euryhalinum]TCO70155.1 cytoskeletal protein CcmA (bactofilin family) [Rhodovulum euryhalinum]
MIGNPDSSFADRAIRSAPGSPPAGRPDRRRALIQEDLRITGNVAAEGIVDVAGEITGDVTADSVVLSRVGRVTGTIRARNVTIDGTHRGTIVATNVALLGAARIEASIICERLSVETGVDLQGDVRCTTEALPAP